MPGKVLRAATMSIAASVACLAPAPAQVRNDASIRCSEVPNLINATTLRQKNLQATFALTDAFEERQVIVAEWIGLSMFLGSLVDFYAENCKDS